MKRFLLLLFLFLLTLSSCKNKKDNDKPNDEDDNTPASTTGFENPDFTLGDDSGECITGDKISINLNNYKNIKAFNITFSDESIIDDNGDGTFFVRKPGECSVKLSLKSYDDVYSIETIKIYARSFSIEGTTNYVKKGDKIKLNIASYENLKEQSLSDFTFSADNNNISINDNIVTALKEGTTTITATSKINKNVKAEFLLEICDPTQKLMISCANDFGVIKTGEICELEISKIEGYTQNDYEWFTKDSEVARVNYYYDKLTIIGVNEGKTTISCINKNDPSLLAYYTFTISGEEQVDYIERLITTAYKEVGTTEGKDDNGKSNNDQKYGIWYRNNKQPWCAMFVSWCWYFSGISNDILLKYQGCSTGEAWCKENNIYHLKESYNPVSGDIVFFLSSNMSHTGIVAYSDSTYIYTIEGNSSDKVGIWRWKKDDEHITGYAHPNYPSTSTYDASWIATTNNNGVYLWTDHDTRTSVL